MFFRNMKKREIEQPERAKHEETVCFAESEKSTQRVKPCVCFLSIHQRALLQFLLLVYHRLQQVVH